MWATAKRNSSVYNISKEIPYAIAMIYKLKRPAQCMRGA